MEYELVFDAARDFAGWHIVAGGVALLGFLITMIFYDRFIPRFIFILFRIRETILTGEEPSLPLLSDY